ncbi:hypothetical protein LCGC14_2990320 [marine sediment metagenome]|uniref:DUF86 domain-containing protein n=1 Tax=marine sediment metagenome TaxID=412755 RepID=A0A0F8X3Y4_9ZZZZ
MRKDEAWLLDVLLACREALEFVDGVSQEEFLGDRQLQSAVSMKLEIIGEAARALSAECKQAHPDIPWQAIVGLRHRIVHEYFRLDLDIIWDILQKDVPELIGLVQPLVPPEDEV